MCFDNNTVVDVSGPGIFPLPIPKTAAHVHGFTEVQGKFEEGSSVEESKSRLERFGFSVEETGEAHAWKRNGDEVGRLYSGEAALSYLRSRQGDFVDFLSTLQGGGSKEFQDGADRYYKEVKGKKGSEE